MVQGFMLLSGSSEINLASDISLADGGHRLAR